MSARKLILLVFAILLAFTAVDVVSWYASPSSIVWKQSGNVVTLPEESFQMTGELEPFQSVIYHLDKPLRGDSNVMFSYTLEDGTSRLIQRKGLQNTAQLVFEIPPARYLYLDCYIDADVRITGVTVSDQPAGRVHAGYQPDFVRILVPSAVLIALILLFAYVRPLNQFIKAVDRKIIDPETRLKGVTVAYIVLAAAALLHHIYVTMYHKYVLTGYTDLGVPLLIFSIITFLFGKLWKDKVSWILLALLCLKYVRSAYEGQQVLNDTTYIYFMSVYAFFGCYGVGRALSRKYWKTFLSAFCCLWTLAALVLASIGLYVIVTRIPIPNFGTEWFTIAGNRAYFVYEPVTAGIILSICMFVALLGCSLTKKRILQGLYILSSLVFFSAGSFTGTRTAYMLSAFLLALLLYIPLRDRVKPGCPKNAALTAGKYCLLFTVCIAAAVAVAFIHSWSLNLLKGIQLQSGLLVSTAYAETEMSLPEITRRDLQLNAGLSYFLSGRLELWKDTLKILTSGPRNLFIGQSVYNPMDLINNFRQSQGLMRLSHCHNTFIQIFLENGLPGLILYLSFIVVFVLHAEKLIRNHELPFWQRILPFGTLLCLAEGMVENTCHVTYGYPQMTILYLFAGFTVALSRQTSKDTSSL